jgi:energy-converting hydrogenase Eha subunit B
VGCDAVSIGKKIFTDVSADCDPEYVGTLHSSVTLVFTIRYGITSQKFSIFITTVVIAIGIVYKLTLLAWIFI